MRTRPHLDMKQNERRYRSFTHIMSQKHNAEEHGRLQEAADLEALAEREYEILGQVGSEDRNKLYLILHAPSHPVNPHQWPNIPQYGQYLTDAHIPPTLLNYIDYRNRRIEIFRRSDFRRRSALAEANISLSCYGTESIQILMGILAAYGDEAFELGPGRIPKLSEREISARRQEVQALREAIKSCIAKRQSWSYGHMLILRHYAGQDLEIKPELERKLDKVVALRRKQWAAERA